MPEKITREEAGQRVELARQAYAGWLDGELWEEFVLLTDEAWAHGGDEPDPIKWAEREGIGLALIGRGATAAELERGWPTKSE